MKTEFKYKVLIQNTNNPNKQDKKEIAQVLGMGDAVNITAGLNKSLHMETPLLYSWAKV